jgi:S-DNA-T family DNA segregation ATPase FtsK/SpoIIIE
LADDLAMALQCEHLSVTRDGGGVVLAFDNPEPRPVRLARLMDRLGPLPESTAVLGMRDVGTPLLAKLSSPDVVHALVAGTTGSGKSVLLRSMAASLVLAHDPREVRMVLMSPKASTFEALADVPHLARPVINEAPEMAEALRSLLRTMERRDERGERPGAGVPRIIVFVDELADLVMALDEAESRLTRLAQRGREAGIHLVAATQRPDAAILSGVMRANFPLRLVGRVVSTYDARVAAGAGGTDAHLLGGRGDFVAVYGGEVQRFQAAYVDNEELRELVATLPSRPAAEILEEATRDVVVPQDEQDALRLLEIAEEQGREWKSQREAESWLLGYNGGTATTRVQQALAWMEEHGVGEGATTGGLSHALRIFAGARGTTG